MNVKLFIPCYIDQFYPQVGIATYQLLQKLGCQVHYPTNQTCCGQPMSNSGFDHLNKSLNKLFYQNFSGDDFIVCPSGSCTLHIKEHFSVDDESSSAIRSNVYELTEFITDVLKIKGIQANFKCKVGFHISCHGQRMLNLSSMSELVGATFSKPQLLLDSINGLDVFYPIRMDECCGFGGTFCVTEEAVSVKMGKDRIQQHLENGVDVIIGNDMSCLMHLEGIINRNGYPLKVMHIAEILNQMTVPCL